MLRFRIFIVTRAWTVQNKNEPLILLKIQSEHRKAISCKFPKSLRGAGDLVALGEVYKKHKNRKILTYSQIPKTL